MTKKKKKSEDKQVPFIKVRQMLREAYMAGFKASGQSNNGETMEQIHRPPIADVKHDAQEYAIARLPRSGR